MGGKEGREVGKEEMASIGARKPRGRRKGKKGRSSRGSLEVIPPSARRSGNIG